MLILVIIPGEDRDWGGSVLYIDLIPQTCWFTNVRSVLPQSEWRDLAGKIRERAGFACEICGFDKMTLDVHERWAYEEKDGRRTQRLVRLIALCKWCHGATHMGYAEFKGTDEKMRRHIARINKWTPSRVIDHRDAAFRRWDERSQHLWDLDISMIENLGYHPKPVPNNEVREAISEQRTVKDQELSEYFQALIDTRTNDLEIIQMLETTPPKVGDFVVFSNQDDVAYAFESENDAVQDAANICSLIKEEDEYITVAFRLSIGENLSVTVVFPLFRPLVAYGEVRPVLLGWFVFILYAGDHATHSNDPYTDYVNWHKAFLPTGLITRAFLENPKDLRSGFLKIDEALTIGGAPSVEECKSFIDDATIEGVLARYRVWLDKTLK